MAKLWRKKLLLSKIEATYGTDATPTGALNAIQAYDFRLMPMEGQDVERPLETPFLGGQETIPADLHAKITFKVELEPSGAAGVAPGWGPLLRACGCAETITADTSVVYNPVSGSFESASHYFNLDGQLHKLRGSRGTAKITIGASAIPYLEFEFTGLWSQPTDTAFATPDFSAFKKPLVATSANTPTATIDEVDMVLRSFELDLGCTVAPRFLVGGESIQITDRKETISAVVEAVPLSTFNPYALATGETLVELQLVHGTAAGRIATIVVPQLQMQRPGAPTENQGIVEWPLSGVPIFDAGNDQWTLTLT
ncbi:phage tail tube protein [Pseudoroseicyclus sp. H15]